MAENAGTPPVDGSESRGAGSGVEPRDVNELLDPVVVLDALSRSGPTQIWWLDLFALLLATVVLISAFVLYSYKKEAVKHSISRFLNRLLARFGLGRAIYRLHIEYNTSVNKWGDESAFDCSSDNQYMLEALFSYAEHLDRLRKARVHLENPDYWNYSGNQYDRMKKKEVMLRPMDSHIQVDSDISVAVTYHIDNRNDKVGRTTYASAVIYSKTSFEKCREFANKAYEFYVEKEFKKYDKEDDKKKLKYYSVRAIDRDSGEITWNQYLLGTQRGFDYLYFDEKEATLKLIDNFTNRNAQFAIGGPAYKLGFLLYGVPGCGKTSFIKALANHTQRHVIDLQLCKFAKNSELRDAFFSEKLTYSWRQTTETVTLPLDKRIIIMEDVDALSDIVARRSETNTWEEKDYKKLKDQGETEVKTESVKEEESSSKTGESKSAIDKYLEKMEGLEDRVNLAALLSILDGTLELTGPILIMTTNLPERLDPALIRSGRITKHLYFGRMSMESIVGMLYFYFKDTICSPGYKHLESEKEESVGVLERADLDEMDVEGDDITASTLRHSLGCLPSLTEDEDFQHANTTPEFKKKYAPLYQMVPGFERLHRRLAPNDLEAICRNSEDLVVCCEALCEFSDTQL